ncbi:MAG: response regulator [Ktedonobacterales bacterium]|nr:response regulator [Ktedonobacterales bacterium]
MARWHPETHPEVVIIDDDPDIRMIVADVLREEGYVPVLFGDGAGAIEHIVRTCPVLILTDLRLPGMSGHDLIRRIRAECGPELAIIVMSGAPNDALAERLLVQGILRKPFELDALCSTVRRWAGQATSAYLSAHAGEPCPPPI